MRQNLHLSVVSHGQGQLVFNLLNDLEISVEANSFCVTLTLNIKEALPFDPKMFSFPIRVIKNAVPKGFAENHNAAFNKFQDNLLYFCAINPDIRFNKDPFPELLLQLKNNSAGIVAPIVVGRSGEIEDSTRRFPTPFKILCKALSGCKGSDYPVSNRPFFPDWVGGMFMLIPRDIFKQLGGFNEKYFLYYEDVDFCARLRLRGYEVLACPEVKVTHVGPSR